MLATSNLFLKYAKYIKIIKLKIMRCEEKLFHTGTMRNLYGNIKVRTHFPEAGLGVGIILKSV
jgi:hypothetical protein